MSDDQTNKSELPLVLGPLSDDYERIELILEALVNESELAARADYAQELIMTCARSEDAKERALYPNIESSQDISALRESAKRLGRAMLPIFRAVRHSVPLDVHTSDPDGFEHDLQRFIDLLARHLESERQELFPALSRLSNSEGRQITEVLSIARRHALEHPLPPHNALARWLTRIDEHIEHLADTSEQYHPARERLAS